MITFDENVKDFILKTLELKVDDEGFLYDEKGRIKTGDGDELMKDEWVGYIDGYGHVRGDLFGLIDLADWCDGKIKQKT